MIPTLCDGEGVSKRSWRDDCGTQHPSHGDLGSGAQYEFAGLVRAISERFLVSLLEGLIDLFTFAIKGFHADNGSEYVNRLFGSFQSAGT